MNGYIYVNYYISIKIGTSIYASYCILTLEKVHGHIDL